MEFIKTYPKTDDDTLIMDMHCTFNPSTTTRVFQQDRKNSKIVLTTYVGKGMAVVPIPVEVSDCAFDGKLQIKIKFGKIFPHIKTIDACLIELPEIGFNLKPLKGMDLLNVRNSIINCQFLCSLFYSLAPSSFQLHHRLN